MVKVKVKYWHDWLGGWEIMREEWMDYDLGTEIDIPEKLIDDYTQAVCRYTKICEKIQEIVNKTVQDK